MAPDEPSLAELGWRMAAVEKKIDGLLTAVASLSFVPRGEYAVKMEAITEKVDAAHRLSQWCLGAIVSGVLIAILTTLVLRSG